MPLKHIPYCLMSARVAQSAQSARPLPGGVSLPPGVLGRAACVARSSRLKSLRSLTRRPCGPLLTREPRRATPVSCNGQAGGLPARCAAHHHLLSQHQDQRAQRQRAVAGTPQIPTTTSTGTTPAGLAVDRTRAGGRLSW